MIWEAKICTNCCCHSTSDSTSDYVTMTQKLDLQNPSWISMNMLWPWNVPSGSFLENDVPVGGAVMPEWVMK